MERWPPRLLLRQPPRPAAATASLLPSVASASPASAHSSSPCACWRWLLPSSHLLTPDPVSPLPTPAPSPALVQRDFAASRCESCGSRRSSESLGRCPPPTPETEVLLQSLLNPP